MWEQVNKMLQGSISRASIINSLNAMVDNGILDYEERTGNGGHHRIYRHRYSEKELKEYLATRFIARACSRRSESRLVQPIRFTIKD